MKILIKNKQIYNKKINWKMKLTICDKKFKQ